VDNKSRRVLVVEDEGLIAHDISTRLTALGHEVVASVGTAEEALGKASGADIVLMDIRIDGPVDGIEAAARIRERYHLPVIFLTAHADRPTVERAKLTGAFGYLVKPIAHASLNTAIEIALYKHQMEARRAGGAPADHAGLGGRRGGGHRSSEPGPDVE
jgi:CheY-like chemotaxis protein